MKRDISLYNVLDGRMYDGEWKDMSEEAREKYFDLFKQFLLDCCRSSSKIATKIAYTNRWEVENCRRFERLIYNQDRGRVEYVAGQDYPSEIRTLKELFVK